MLLQDAVLMYPLTGLRKPLAACAQSPAALRLLTHLDPRGIHCSLEIQIPIRKWKGLWSCECTIKLPRCGSFLLEQPVIIEDGFVKKAIKIFQMEYKVMMQWSIAQIPGFWNKPCCHGLPHWHSLTAGAPHQQSLCCRFSCSVVTQTQLVTSPICFLKLSCNSSVDCCPFSPPSHLSLVEQSVFFPCAVAELCVLHESLALLSPCLLWSLTENSSVRCGRGLQCVRVLLFRVPVCCQPWLKNVHQVSAWLPLLGEPIAGPPSQALAQLGLISWALVEGRSLSEFAEVFYITSSVYFGEVTDYISIKRTTVSSFRPLFGSCLQLCGYKKAVCVMA